MVWKPGQPWRVAKSLNVLLSQLDAAAPNRNKRSDGSIGDTAHSNRTSDHNPNEKGVVCARDFTHDPAGDMDCQVLADALKKSKDRRIKYVIWNGQIMSGAHSTRAWVWREYTGPNPHKTHLHISVIADPAGYDNPAPWQIGVKPPLVLVVDGTTVGDALIIEGRTFAPVRALCEAAGLKVEFGAEKNEVRVTK